MTSLDEYYNKFNEDKRLDSRHGRVEFIITMKYIHDFLKPGDKILEIGAGTGRYSITLFNEGYEVTAVEPVQHNLGRLKQKCPEIKAFKGNALRLKRLPDDEYDMTLLFGPMYHLIGHEDKLKALLEAKRVTKPGGIIMAAYIMNEYSVLTYAFKEQHVLECIAEGKLDKGFKTVAGGDDLYDYVRTEDIDLLAKEAGLDRVKIFSPDGPANHMRMFLNRLREEEFERFIEYQMAVCERADLLGASAHTVDILKKAAAIR